MDDNRERAAERAYVEQCSQCLSADSERTDFRGDPVKVAAWRRVEPNGALAWTTCRRCGHMWGVVA